MSGCHCLTLREFSLSFIFLSADLTMSRKWLSFFRRFRIFGVAHAHVRSACSLLAFRRSRPSARDTATEFGPFFNYGSGRKRERTQFRRGSETFLSSSRCDKVEKFSRRPENPSPGERRIA